MKHSRREVLLGVGAAAIAAKGLASDRAGAEPLAGALSSRLGVQLYMLGHVDPQALPGALKSLAGIGYREVEGSPSGMAAVKYRAALDAAGLRCTSIHTGIDPAPNGLSLARTSDLVTFAKTVGTKNIVVAGYPVMSLLPEPVNINEIIGDAAKIAQLSVRLKPLVDAMTVDNWLWYTRQLNEYGAKLASAGLRIGCHNHAGEFIKLANGRNLYELLMAETDPKLVDFELDLGWARAADFDPSTVLKLYGPRVTQLHAKDFRGKVASTGENPAPADIGQGIQDWNAIADAIKQTSVQHLYIEQEPPYPVSGLKSAAIGYAFLRPLLASKGI